MRSLMVSASLLGACVGASAELGHEAQLQVAGAQWRPGPPPDDEAGPPVLDVALPRLTFVRDGASQRLAGTLAPGATAAWVGLDGDSGGWIITAGSPSVDAPTAPTLTAEAAITPSTALGPQVLRVIAIDEQAQPGPARSIMILVEDVPPPPGTLVVSLAWQGRADLDLHVIAPDGGEAWSGDPNTWEPPPPGTPIDPDAWRAGGLLDRDGNAACHRDARPRENVVWTAAPPPGRYRVRVDARSLCGDAVAYYDVALFRDGAPIASGRGVATPADVELPHGAGAGLTLLDIVLP
jgi:hypothetical protein